MSDGGMQRGAVGRSGARRLPGVLLVVALTACSAIGGRTGSDGAAASPEVPPRMDSAVGNYLAGRYAQHEHDYPAAAQYFRRALAAHPDDLDLENKTFVFDTTAGRMGEAVLLAGRINHADPNAALPNLVLAVARLKARDYAASAAFAEKLPQQGVQRFAVPLLLAWAKAGAGEDSAAAHALAALRAVQGFAPIADFHEGLIADWQGRTEDAEAAYQRVRQVSAHGNWRIVEALGSLDERTDRRPQALALYRDFIAENPDSDLVAAAQARLAAASPPPPRVAGPSAGAAEGLFDLATLLNQSETTDLALIYGRLALDLEPDFPLAKLLVADILETQNQPAEALALDRSVAPGSPYAWIARLRAAGDLVALDRADEAIAELRRMAAERPHETAPLVELGDLLRDKKRYGEAIAAYDEAVTRIGAAVGPRDWGLFYSRGVAYERAGDWPRAEADLERALQFQPDQPAVLNYLGYSWIDKGSHLDEALRMIQRAVALRPEDGYIVDSLGWAFYRLGNYAQATLQLEHAVELRPDDPTINDHLGDAYWQSGRRGEARSQWRRALQFGPETDEMRTIEAKLDRGLVRPAPIAKAAQGG